MPKTELEKRQPGLYRVTQRARDLHEMATRDRHGTATAGFSWDSCLMASATIEAALIGAGVMPSQDLAPEAAPEEEPE